MDKKQLVRIIQQANDGIPFITRKRLAAILGHPDPKSVDHILYHLPSINQRYLIEDVAESIMEKVKYR